MQSDRKIEICFTLCVCAICDAKTLKYEISQVKAFSTVLFQQRWHAKPGISHSSFIYFLEE